MAWPIIGKSFSPAEFEAYVQGLGWDGDFRPDGIVLHNTAAPSLAQRPNGLEHKHILNLQTYYKTPKPKGCGWSGGPHLFIDDRQIWVFNPLTKRGTHSPSWNASKLGIEMLGDFDKESFSEGRGKKVRDNTVAAVAILNKKLGFTADGFKFHNEDKATTHACPGKKARSERAALIAEINAAMAAGVEASVEDEDAIPLDVDATDDMETAETPAKEKVTFRQRAQVLQETIDMGSRLGSSIRSGLNAIYLLLLGGTAVGTGASTLLDTKKGNAQVATDALSPYPVLLVALFALLIGMAITGGIAWWFLRRASNGLVTAVRTQRYVPPKQSNQSKAEG